MKLGYKKIATLVVLCVFSLHQALSAAGPISQPLISVTEKSSPEIQLPKIASQIQIPQHLGTIEERFIAGDFDAADVRTPLIIHIQDAHGNLEAQKSIQGILQFLHEQYGFDLIFREGAGEAIQPDLMRFFEVDAMNLSLANLLMKDGLIGGLEMFLLEAENSVQGLGIENPELYQKNLEQLKSIYHDREKIDNAIEKIDFAIGTLASKHLHKRLLEFFKKWVRQHRLDAAFLGNIKTLTQFAKEELNLEFSDARLQLDWPQMVRFSRLQKLESSFSAQMASQEREQLTHWMTERKLNTDVFEKEKTQIRAFLEHLHDALSPHGFSFKQYPNLSQYWGTLVLSEELNAAQLFGEIDRLTDLILEKLTRNDTEALLLGLYQNTLILEKLWHLELTHDDYLQFLEKREALQPARLIQTIQALDGALLKDLKEKYLSHLFQQADQFYQTAIVREPLLFENLVRQMIDKKRAHGVLITGGFHSEGMAGLMKANDFSFIRIAPKMKGEVEESSYEDLMTLKDDFMVRRSQVMQLSAAEGSGLISLERSVGVEYAHHYGRRLVANVATVLAGEMSKLLPESRPAYFSGAVGRLNQSPAAQRGNYHFALVGDREAVFSFSGNLIASAQDGNAWIGMDWYGPSLVAADRITQKVRSEMRSASGASSERPAQQELPRVAPDTVEPVAPPTPEELEAAQKAEAAQRRKAMNRRMFFTTVGAAVASAVVSGGVAAATTKTVTYDEVTPELTVEEVPGMPGARLHNLMGKAMERQKAHQDTVTEILGDMAQEKAADDIVPYELRGKVAQGARTVKTQLILTNPLGEQPIRDFNDLVIVTQPQLRRPAWDTDQSYGMVSTARNIRSLSINGNIVIDKSIYVQTEAQRIALDSENPETLSVVIEVEDPQKEYAFIFDTSRQLIRNPVSPTRTIIRIGFWGLVVGLVLGAVEPAFRFGRYLITDPNKKREEPPQPAPAVPQTPAVAPATVDPPAVRVAAMPRTADETRPAADEAEPNVIPLKRPPEEDAPASARDGEPEDARNPELLALASAVQQLNVRQDYRIIQAFRILLMRGVQPDGLSPHAVRLFRKLGSIIQDATIYDYLTGMFRVSDDGALTNPLEVRAIYKALQVGAFLRLDVPSRSLHLSQRYVTRETRDIKKAVAMLSETSEDQADRILKAKKRLLQSVLVGFIDEVQQAISASTNEEQVRERILEWEMRGVIQRSRVKSRKRSELRVTATESSGLLLNQVQVDQYFSQRRFYSFDSVRAVLEIAGETLPQFHPREVVRTVIDLALAQPERAASEISWQSVLDQAKDALGPYRWILETSQTDQPVQLIGRMSAQDASENMELAVLAILTAMQQQDRYELVVPGVPKEEALKIEQSVERLALKLGAPDSFANQFAVHASTNKERHMVRLMQRLAGTRGFVGNRGILDSEVKVLERIGHRGALLLLKPEAIRQGVALMITAALLRSEVDNDFQIQNLEELMRERGIDFESLVTHISHMMDVIEHIAAQA